MTMLQAQHKGEGDAEERCLTRGRQALGLVAPHLDGKDDARGGEGLSMQDAGAARLDLPAQHGGGAGDQRPLLDGKIDSVVGDKPRAAADVYEEQDREAGGALDSVVRYD